MTFIDPLLFLGCSILLVAVSLTALVVAAFPAIQDLSRAARSAEKLFDRLDRELPPTLEAIRLASLELSDLSDEMSQGVQSATAVVQQVDLSLTQVKKQAGNVQTNTRSVWVGVKAAWQTWRDRGDSHRRERLSTAETASLPQSPARLDRDWRELDYLEGADLDENVEGKG
ncbi:hypothetical protein [Chamaesiphon minutus]|uniref:DUF948 domain-containing protein n=1 Tax=Chamaesiphon minutus (strain ATCC 27169 / PCC 6605) TaxID=1173020 RepID=K9ULL0_CHAP6|nr:hypothetical protein [Chamaesiphon minutus]AFY95553.1 hypothetical protein Cha6605_4635 [Chamaesiphon minutus PCC 6605]